MSSTNSKNSEIGSIKFAKESKEKAEQGRPSKFLKYQKSLLFVFSILVAGFIELLIIIFFASTLSS